MHVITRKRLNDFAARHPSCTSALKHWFQIMKTGSFSNFQELRRAYLTPIRWGG